MTFQGMDVETARSAAQQMRDAQQRLTAEHEELHGRIAQSPGFWRGADAERFRDVWGSSVSPIWQSTLERLQRAADTVDAHVQEQERASGAGDGGAPGGDGTSRTLFDGEGDGEISQDVRDAWSSMSQEDRQQVLQEMVDREFDSYDMDQVDITFFDEAPDPDTGLVTFGSWSEGRQELRLNQHLLDEPDLMLTTVHEVRHAAQYEFIDQTDSGLLDWLPFVDGPEADYERIEDEHGITREEIEQWRENFEGDNYIRPEDDFEGYRDQPVEVDARAREDSFAEELTFEELQQYQRDAGVDVSESPG